MIVGSAWAWALGGIVAFLVVGLLVALALGLVGVPGDFVRRRKTPDTEVVRGVRVPDEVPERTPEEAAEEADRVERERDA